MARDFRERARKRGKEMNEKKRFTLKEDDNTFRVLHTPAGETTDEVFHEYGMHYDIGPNKVGLRCGHNVLNGKGRCYTCDVKIPKLRKVGKTARAEAAEMKPAVIMNVSSVNEDGEFSLAKPFFPAKKLGAEIITRIIGSKKRDYLSHKKGYNISVSRTGTGRRDTRYSSIEPDDEPSKVPSSVIAALKPFDAPGGGLPKYSEAMHKAAWEGRDLSEVRDEEKDDDMAAGTKKNKEKVKTKKKGRKDEDEDEDDEELDDVIDEDDDDEDEDDDEDDKKKKKKKVKASKKKKKSSDDDEDEDEDEEEEDEDEDEDEEEEDEDEDEEPKKKKKGKVKATKKKKDEDDEDEDEDEDEDSDEDEDEDEDSDEDEDEDEEEEKPKKKKKVVKKKKTKK